MPQYYCCVPNCSSSGPAIKFLNFPIDPTIRQQWLSVIPRENWVVDHTTVICPKHFKSNEIDLNPLNGKLTLNNPTVIPNVFSALVSKQIPHYCPKHMFELKSRDFGPETFGDLENFPNSGDFIVDFYFLMSKYQEKLVYVLDKWQIQTSEDCLTLCMLSVTDVVSIVSSICINSELQVTVMLSGRIMDPLDLTMYLPVSCKVNRWSQLEMLMVEFGGEKVKCEPIKDYDFVY